MSDFFLRRMPDEVDPAVAAARAARREAAEIKAARERERLEHERKKREQAEQVLGEMARIALSVNVDTDTRIKAANTFLDRVMPKQKSVEFSGEVGMQVEHRGYIPPAERLMTLSFDEALEETRRRLAHYDAQRAQAAGGQVLIEAQRGDDDGE